jgi:hypothetical protein
MNATVIPLRMSSETNLDVDLAIFRKLTGKFNNLSELLFPADNADVHRLKFNYLRQSGKRRKTG